MQIKTTLIYNLTPVRIARIYNTDDNLCWRGCEVRETLIHFWWGCKYVLPLWKSEWQSLKKLGVTQPQVPLIPLLLMYPLLGMYPRYVLSYYKSICSTMIIAALSLIAIAWKQPRCPTREEWLMKLWTIYTLELYQVVKNNDILKFACKWMEIENALRSEITQT